MAIAISDLNKRITILTPLSADDGLRKTIVYQAGSTVWAKVDYLSDSQRWRAAGPMQAATVRVSVRKTTASALIDTNYRFRIGTTDYSIDGVKVRVDDQNFIEITGIQLADPSVMGNGTGIGTGSIAPTIYIQDAEPAANTPGLWVQTGLGNDGNDFSIWVKT